MLISLTVLIGLSMAAKIIRRPGLKRSLVALHEYFALAALVAIGVHGLALLGDKWLRPGLRGITVPFALSYRPGMTGIGIIAGYLALLLGPSFYLRRRIGARRWRKLHRATAGVWVLSAVHALGSGTDGGTLWLRVIVLAPVVPIVYVGALRVLNRRPAPASVARRNDHERTAGAVQKPAGDTAHKRFAERTVTARAHEQQVHPVVERRGRDCLGGVSFEHAG